MPHRMVLFDLYTTGQHFNLARSFFCRGLCQSIREFKMATQVAGRKRIPNREKLSAEDDALSQIAREAEARLAAKRAARAEAREIRMKELERQQKEIYQAQKKYYGLDSKWGHIEQWMEDSERYSRHSWRHASISDDEERMSVGSRGSLRGNHIDLCSSTSSLPTARLQNGRPSDYNGFLGSSSRASSRASSARASPVVEERSDFLEKGSRTASTLSAATLASLGGGLSRRGSCDTSISADTEASIREMKDSLVEVEEKYRKAMVSNAQLDNEKTNLMYQVDTLRDTLMELEELLCETRRECEEKTRDLERERHAHNVLKFQFEEMKETLRQSEELLTEAQQSRGKQADYFREIADLQETLEWKDKKIRALERQKKYSDIIHDEREALRDEVCRLRDALKKHGIVLGSEVTTNGEVADGTIDGHADVEAASRLNQDSHMSIMSGDSMLEIRLRKLVEERECLLDQVRKYKTIAEQKQKNGTEGAGSTDEDDLQNGLDPHILDLQRDANRQISDLKFKLVKSEQEVTALEQSIIRLEGQVSRYKTSAEAAEKVEDELKVEKRKLQRELRSALDRIDELEASNSHLTKRLEKMKANRSALLAQQ
ncbi:leucine-rich repeat flightless-interacting protein 2-like isoform X6 [Sinocyclocheilus anshuiensis]|uniref:leucine-rich repeat flightless-interacting protein 2-like isoform X6 n=1 Tax=Sinocyclocheilus anshuiensis TaxID=1608454 RepID=UPI0007BA0F75|nr:PREDICTED: leucine-rich repeat flightless-interacting protein 2-like isoform X6 [Sinocyclocheilus anshuiensis]